MVTAARCIMVKELDERFFDAAVRCAERDAHEWYPITILIQCHCLKVGQTANLILNSIHEYTV